MGWLKSLLLGGRRGSGLETASQDLEPNGEIRQEDDGEVDVRGGHREETSTGQLLKKEFGFHDSCELGHVRMHEETPTGRYDERRRTAAPHELRDLPWEPSRQRKLSQKECEERRRESCQGEKWGSSQKNTNQLYQSEQLRKDSAKSNPIAVTPLCKDLGFTSEFPLREALDKSNLSQKQVRLADDLSSCLKSIQTDVATLTRELSELLDSK